MINEFSTMLSAYGRVILMGASLVSALLIILFSASYVSRNTEHDLKTKLLDIIAMFLYIAMFFLYILAGIYLTGSAPIGVCAGIGAFWAMLTFKSYVQRRHAEKMSTRRREEIEAIKRGSR